MIHDMPRPQHRGINHRLVYRIYTADGLSIRKRKKTKHVGVRVPLVAALAVLESGLRKRRHCQTQPGI
jgi:putative transposase